MLNDELQASLEMWNVRFGAFAREGRKAKNITQKKLCKDLNLAQSYYSNLENGLNNIDLGLAMAICKYLDLNINDLLKQ